MNYTNIQKYGKWMGTGEKKQRTKLDVQETGHSELVHQTMRNLDTTTGNRDPAQNREIDGGQSSVEGETDHIFNWR